MEVFEIQKLILELLPQWYYKIAKPFKQQLEEGISIEMCYCLRIIYLNNNMMSMSEIAKEMKMPKQQMTKLVNRLIELDFVERVYDNYDRRIIKLKLTEKAHIYVNGFIEKNGVCFKKLIESMSKEKRDEFAQSLFSIYNILKEVPCLLKSEAIKTEGKDGKIC